MPHWWAFIIAQRIQKETTRNKVMAASFPTVSDEELSQLLIVIHCVTVFVRY